MFFWSLFEFDCERIATESDCFCCSSDFGPKFTLSCYRIANASGQAASASPHAIFNSLNAEYS